MTNTEKLNQYLLEDNKDNNAFLLNSNNNGKIIMLSGAWGAGKTHFWQKKIEPILSDKLKKEDKACVYVSLYGKDNLNSLKEEVYIKASSINELISSEVSTFGFEALSSIQNSDLKIGSVIKAGVNLVNYRKTSKGKNRIKDGGIVCFDDFERKSKSIDLNDLFGFISALAIDMNCKVVIILNSNVFEGKEAEVFKQVKEKTVNKFFYFNPTITELFQTISNDKKYDQLNNYKNKILNTIEETEELNARLYIQVLDNCLEWIESSRELDDNIIHVLVLTMINFVLNHMILDYKKINCENNDCKIAYDIIESYPEIVLIRSLAGCHFLDRFQVKDIKSYRNYCTTLKDTQLIDTMRNNVTQTDLKPSTDDLSIDTQKFKYPESLQRDAINWIKSNEQELKALWKYGYRLYYVGDVDKETYEDIAEFVKTGILL